MRLLLRLFINAAALWVAVRLVPGISFAGNPLLLLAVALVFGVVNTIVKPLVTLLSLPAVLLTLGIFLLVINALMLWFTGWLSTSLGLGFQVDGFGAASRPLTAWLRAARSISGLGCELGTDLADSAPARVEVIDLKMPQHARASTASTTGSRCPTPIRRAGGRWRRGT